MALRYTESISSMAAESLNRLRRSFIELMKTSFELKITTSNTNKDLVDFISENMLKSAEREKKAKDIEGWASIASGIVGLAAGAGSLVVGIRSEAKIQKNNKGLRKIGKLKAQDPSGATTGKSKTAAPVSGDIILKDLKVNDLRTKKSTNYTKKNIAAARKGKDGRAIDAKLKSREEKWKEKVRKHENIKRQIGIFTQAVTTATSSISQGTGSILSARETLMKNYYNAGVEVGRNIMEGNNTIGQSEQGAASKAYDFASSLVRIADELDRHSVLRG